MDQEKIKEEYVAYLESITTAQQQRTANWYAAQDKWKKLYGGSIPHSFELLDLKSQFGHALKVMLENRA